ncbi:MAG: nitronate monooxygenase [Gemmatimonadales bacterium]
MLTTTRLAPIIQGGMGAAVSDWRLANAVARIGQLGVVSGTGIDTVFCRRLQDGDPGGHLRRAMAHFPLPGVADEVIARFHRPEGRAPDEPYELLSLHRPVMSAARQRLTMLASFAEVWLAREGHEQPVGINLLTKIQLPTLATLFGAMLAGVDVVIMGAGIPREIPGALDRLARFEPARIRFEVEGGSSEAEEWLEFDPREHWDAPPVPLSRPDFLAIISSNLLATVLARKASGQVNGFVIEGPTAGGHNAPPRGPLQLNDRGEPIYGDRDVVNLDKVRELGLPFWLAGGTGRAGALEAARAAGAAGIQVGTLFAYCDESGLAEPLKRSVLEHAARGEVAVRTDPRASPTGYPFKVVEWPAAPVASGERERVCDLGYLRVAYRREDGRVDFRCSGEPVAVHLKKGGSEEDTVGRTCLCNGLLAAAGLPQARAAGFVEPPIVTSGDDLVDIGRFLGGRTRYSAADVIRYLLEASE